MKKGTLKPKIEKRALLSLFTVFVHIFVEKNRKLQSKQCVVIKYGLIRKTDICFCLYIKDYW